MQHLAILSSHRKLLAKILSGEKTIESRWYKSKSIPWNRIKAGETIYFKESGKPVTAKAIIAKVDQYYIPQTNIPQLLHQYGSAIGIPAQEIDQWIPWCQERKYCILIHLYNVEKITPFEIDKKGFGLMAAWITIENINKIQKNKR